MINYRVEINLIRVEEHRQEILCNEHFNFILYDLAYEVFQKIRLFTLKLKDK